LQVLQDRNYVRLDKRRFIPEDRGRLVTAFLTSFFERYVEYNFTADLENQLDDISGGRIDWKEVLRNFWRDFSSAIDGTKDLTIGQVLKSLDEELGRHFFPDDGGERDPRLCPVCNAGRLGLKLGRFGAFIGCSNYPECRYTRALGIEAEGEQPATDLVLGNDPETGLTVGIKKGPYGHYVQLGEAENGNKPKRVALPRSMNPADVDLDTALRLLALPRDIGRHPDSGETITAGIGRFGPYLKHGKAFASIGADDDVLTIGLNRAVTVIAEASNRAGRRTPQILREIGEHPDGGKIAIYSGRYGPYVGHDGTIASLPKGANPDILTFDAAVELLAVQKAKGKSKRPGRKAAAKSATGKSATSKPAAAKSNGAKAAARAKSASTASARNGAAASKTKPTARRAAVGKRAGTTAKAKAKPAGRDTRATGARSSRGSA
jgi:DNA topoisomerase-1